MGSGGYGIARVLETRQGLATPYFCVPRKKLARTQCRRNDIGRGEGEEEEVGGRGPDASVKSHVPSRVHRNARAVCMPVSGHARACWWSPPPALSRAQVDAARARYIALHRAAWPTQEAEERSKRKVASSKRGATVVAACERVLEGGGTEYGRGH